MLHNANRQELFGRRHGIQGSAAGGDAATPENPYSGAAASAGNISREKGLARETDVLSRAGQQIDEFLEKGRMVLGDLGEQRDLLKSTQRRIYTVASTLGVSNETIRLVERRAFQDKWFFYGGIILMLVCFYYILKWF